MNAPPFLLEKVLRATVGVHSHIPSTHVSTAIGLGTDRRGTGAIVSPDGLILTAHYLLLGAQNVIVTMPGGEQLEAKIVGKDYGTGIGLLKIDRDKTPCVEVVSAEKCVVGQEAFTVSSLGGEKRCADCGIITYLGPFDAVWEFVLDKCVCVTAASLNIGMSGGPICNLQAQVVAQTHLSSTNSQTASKGPRYVMMPQSAHRFSPPRLATVNASCPTTHFSDDTISTQGILSRSIFSSPSPVL